MVTESPDSQVNQGPLILGWGDVYPMVGAFAKRLPQGCCFGIPRGGAVVAGLTHRATTDPRNASCIVDDIYDSGRTMRKWRAKWPDLPYFALFDKRKPEWRGKWLQMPWEEDAERDAEDNVVRMLEFLGEDPDREGLRDTPRRVVKAWREMTVGYGQDPRQILSADFHGNGYDQMVVCRNVAFHSICEHHLLNFSGFAHVAYVPRSRVVGLSKMARLVDCFARRLQIQEKLTQEIAEAMKQVLNPLGVGVTIRARHLCMSCRGVMKDEADMVTTCLLGVFKKHAVREEFFLHCRG